MSKDGELVSANVEAAMSLINRMTKEDRVVLLCEMAKAAFTEKEFNKLIDRLERSSK